MNYSNFFRNIILPTFDKLNDLRISESLIDLEKSQWWSTSELISLQEEKLCKLIDHAYNNVPYYRKLMMEYRLQPEDIRKIGDLSKIPLLTREIVRKYSHDLHSIDLPDRNTRVKSTGGTTGEPLQYHIDWDAWSHITACRFRGQGFGGYTLGDKIATLAGSSLIPTINPGLREQLRWKLERNLPLSAVHLTSDIMSDYFIRLQHFEPKYIIGYPTALYVFADFMKQNMLHITNVNGIFTTAEVLQPNHREMIEEVFQCSLFDAYGCGDGGIIATECQEHKGLHIAMEHAIVEFLGPDSYPINSGPGSVVVTDLYNYAQPFIRYEVGDNANISTEQCSCGRGLTLVKSIDGRKTDILKFNNGVTISGPAITLMFRDTKILQYQLVQEDGDTLIVNLRKASDTRKEDIEHIRNLLFAHLGNDINIIVKIVDDISPTRSGKQQFIISKLNK